MTYISSKIYFAHIEHIHCVNNTAKTLSSSYPTCNFCAVNQCFKLPGVSMAQFCWNARSIMLPRIHHVFDFDLCLQTASAMGGI